MKLTFRHVQGSALGTIGYLLSPLSFWNDIFINFPIAYAVAFVVALINPAWFAPAMILAYWGTNVLGFVLMRKGYVKLKNQPGPSGKKGLIIDIAAALGYSALISILIATGVLHFPAEWLHRG